MMGAGERGRWEEGCRNANVSSVCSECVVPPRIWHLQDPQRSRCSSLPTRTLNPCVSRGGCHELRTISSYLFPFILSLSLHLICSILSPPHSHQFSPLFPSALPPIPCSTPIVLLSLLHFMHFIYLFLKSIFIYRGTTAVRSLAMHK
jgi:hypothetical protein